MENDRDYQLAKTRIESRMGFYTHLSVYVAVILLLVVINLLTSPDAIWFQWPMLGWGIAVVLHALSVLVFPGRFTVTDEMIEKEMGRLRKRS